MYGLRLLSLRSWLGGESRLTLGLNFVLELVNPLALVLRFLLVLFPILLRLHDVVHEVIDVLIILLLLLKDLDRYGELMESLLERKRLTSKDTITSESSPRNFGPPVLQPLLLDLAHSPFSHLPIPQFRITRPV